MKEEKPNEAAPVNANANPNEAPKESVKPVGKEKEKEKPKTETAAKTVPEKGAKGSVGIEQISLDSRCITLENTGSEDCDLTGWKIQRKLDDTRTVEYKFPRGALLPAAKKLKASISLLLINFCCAYLNLSFLVRSSIEISKNL